MAEISEVKVYSSYDIDTFLVKEDSVLNFYAQKDNIEIDQDFEGVPGGNIIFGGMQIRKKKYTDPANGIWIGIDSDGVAKFAMGDGSGGISWDGTTLTLTGSDYLSAGEAADDVNNNATTISGTKITTGTITADRMNVSTLSSISANIGSITSGTITSALIRTSSSGARVEIDDANDRIEIYDSSVQRMRLDQDELTFYNSAGTLMATFAASGSNYMYINTASGATLGLLYAHNGTTVAGFTSAGLNLVSSDLLVGSGTCNVGSSGSPFSDGYFTTVTVDQLAASSTSADIGSSTTGFDRLYIEEIFMEGGNASNPSVDGELVYYDSGTEGLRMQFGGSDFQFDATAV